MKITTFNPQIITGNAEPLVQLFEELGFQKRHNQEGIGDLDVTGIRMKDENGFYLDISQPDSLKLPNDLVAIRMNVDNFDEAYQLLTKHGFKNFYGEQTVSTGTSKSAVLISPSGFTINLIEHLK
ncbi:VOC family protein [[Clostridium] aminophilum]|uniref:VOC domain-containing protein n=1 Tax=[Clostridium] aminophilum TaxID=1526 RepID=A0A1I6J7Y5_9FIRM|nr:glyoxalase/bleomycin resistance/dioxygenase family protein [[Clostridium] aminophilum]MCR4628175.1 glyoxalase/bleomycin resistance/dioxygenase family protein [Clostridium sp.]SFR75076.1 hypothetical protein SAMN02910262_01271 [[Clostridium] aminophilum]